MSDEGEEESSDRDDDDDDDVSGSSDEDEHAEEESDVSGSDESVVDSEEDSDSGPDLARGKGNIETSSEDEEDDVDVVLRREEEEMEHAWGDLCKDAPRTDEVRRQKDVCLSGGQILSTALWSLLQVSARLAVCNMDWDRLKAKDLLVLLKSFSPTGGAVLSVKVKLL